MSPYCHIAEVHEQEIAAMPEPSWLERWKWWLAMTMVAACWGLIVSGVVWLI